LGYSSDEKLKSNRSKGFALSISLQIKAISNENIPQAPGNAAEAGQNHDARKAVSANL